MRTSPSIVFRIDPNVFLVLDDFGCMVAPGARLTLKTPIPRLSSKICWKATVRVFPRGRVGSRRFRRDSPKAAASIEPMRVANCRSLLYQFVEEAAGT